MQSQVLNFSQTVEPLATESVITRPYPTNDDGSRIFTESRLDPIGSPGLFSAFSFSVPIMNDYFSDNHEPLKYLQRYGKSMLETIRYHKG